MPTLVASAEPTVAPTVEESAGEPAASLAEAQDTVDRLIAAGVAGDRAAWDARSATSGAAWAARSAVLFDNLRAVSPERLRVRLTGAELQLPDDRSSGLASTARVLQAQLTWRLDAEPDDATATVWLTLVPGPDGPRLAGTGDGPDLDTSPQPLWWLAPTTKAVRGRATVLAGPGQDAAAWADLAARAASAVRTHLPGALGRDWDGRVVVEVPGDQGDLGRVLGSEPSAYAGTAAVTRPEGPTTDAALRVVVNPAVGSPDRASEAELGTLLTHETVHVATRSAASPAPLWAVEGLAEHVALQAHPDQRATELAALRGTASTEPGLPSDADLAAGGAQVTTAYARSWLACRAVADRRGEAALGRLYAALDAGASLDRAARSALGVGGATVSRWARDERERALDRGRG